VVLTETLLDFAARYAFAHPAAAFGGVKAETAGFRHTIAEDVFGASQVTVFSRQFLELLSGNTIPQALPITSCR